MFDNEELAGWPTRRLLEAVADNHRQSRQVGCDQLLLAAAFADDQSRDGRERDEVPAAWRSTIDGGRGAVAIDEDAVAEFGACYGVGMVAARGLIGSSVRVRWQFPILWARVREASVLAWQARKISEAAVNLDYEQCRDLDARMSPLAGSMPWPRFSRLLQAAIGELDADGLAERAERAAGERYVRSCQSEDGLKLLIARAEAGDIAIFEATLHRIADVLKIDGDADELPVRLARAVGILGNPALALHLLATHVDQGSGTITPDLEPGPVVADEAGCDAPPVDPQEQAERDHVALSASTTSGPFGSDPTSWDPRKLAPKVVLYFHLSESAIDPGFDPIRDDRLTQSAGLVRPEHGDYQSLGQLKEFLAGTGCRVSVRPVVVPADQEPVDAYEVPQRIREAVQMRHHVDMFPFASTDRALDLDHTQPWRTDGPAGQTGLHNLAPLSRSSHRMATPRPRVGGRTTGRWHKRQPTPGTMIWRSPHGRVFLTTGTGTIDLGDNPYAEQVWAVACPRERVA